MKDVIDLTNVLELLDCKGVSKIEIPDGYISEQPLAKANGFM